MREISLIINILLRFHNIILVMNQQI